MPSTLHKDLPFSTSSSREVKSLLFVSYKVGHKGDISPVTLSSCIRRLLKFAYTDPPEDVLRLVSLRTHEVRGYASSLAFRGSVCVEDILRACTWKNKGTFISHYLKDISLNSENLFQLGPLVAAQKMAEPRSSRL